MGVFVLDFVTNNNKIGKNMKYYLIRKNRETGRVWKAICEEKNGKYVVKAGSIISNVELLGCPMLIQQIRRTAKINQHRILLEDVEFQTLDHAASFVLATNAIGKREFKKLFIFS